MTKIPKTEQAQRRRLKKVDAELSKLETERRKLLTTLNLCDHGRDRDAWCRSCLHDRGFSAADMGY